MRTYDEWLAELESEQYGRLWLRKFRYDLKNGNMPPYMEQTLKATVETKLKAGASVAIAVLEAVITENPRSFDLVGLRIPANRQQYSLAVQLETFALYYLNRRALMTILDERDDEYDKVWDGLNKEITPNFYKGLVRTDREFFWCSPKRTVARIVADYKPNRAATTLRNRLGLDQIAKGQRMILIDIPPNALNGKKLCAPTTLDAGLNPVFVPFNDPDGYGRTLNLKTSTRDLREVVGEQIPFNETFGAAKLGRVGAKVPAISWANIESLL